MKDPLPSWREGATKQAIVNFVDRVTDRNGPDFVQPAERIATFDNDGTLWCEQPIQAQLYFAFDRLAELAKSDPSMKERQPFKAFLEHDIEAIKTQGKEGVFTFMLTTHAGETPEEFDEMARAWLATARHPRLGRLFTENIYQPQLELLDYLRANAFATFIVTGGGIDFVRAFSEESYGIPRQQVIGSSVKSRFEVKDGSAGVTKLKELGSFDDREAKAENIYLHIGRRPILVFGNSDGDLAMMRYVRSGRHPSLALMLHHDDAEREFAYDREFKLSRLVEGLDKADEYGLTVVRMKRDWKTVFPESKALRHP